MNSLRYVILDASIPSPSLCATCCRGSLRHRPPVQKPVGETHTPRGPQKKFQKSLVAGEAFPSTCDTGSVYMFIDDASCADGSSSPGTPTSHPRGWLRLVCTVSSTRKACLTRGLDYTGRWSYPHNSPLPLLTDCASITNNSPSPFPFVHFACQTPPS